MTLNKAGLDYLLEVARGLGFRVVETRTVEDYTYGPEITIELVQLREPKPPEEPPLFTDARGGVSEDQAAEIAAKGKMKTLDDYASFNSEA